MALGKSTFDDNTYNAGRPEAEKLESCKLLGSMFTGMMGRMMDPVDEIYSHGIASQTLLKEIAAE